MISRLRSDFYNELKVEGDSEIADKEAAARDSDCIIELMRRLAAFSGFPDLALAYGLLNSAATGLVGTGGKTISSDAEHFSKLRRSPILLH